MIISVPSSWNLSHSCLVSRRHSSADMTSSRDIITVATPVSASSLHRAESEDVPAAHSLSINTHTCKLQCWKLHYIQHTWHAEMLYSQDLQYIVSVLGLFKTTFRSFGLVIGTGQGLDIGWSIWSWSWSCVKIVVKIIIVTKLVYIYANYHDV